MKILELGWQVLNTPAGITAMAGALLFLVNKLYDKKPKWAAYEGAIISGIKFAEKQIPDGTENKGLAKLDSALQYVVKVYTQARGKQPPPKVKAEMAEGIQIVHDQLQARGTLSQ